MFRSELELPAILRLDEPVELTFQVRTFVAGDFFQPFRFYFDVDGTLVEKALDVSGYVTREPVTAKD